ncbi:MAG: beta-N-acetylhexosaminidase [Bradymonadia bacterium]
MSLPELKDNAGRMLVAGFDGPSLPKHVAAALREGSLGGVILFARNVDTPDQVASLNAQVYATRQDRLPIVSVDQEGGRVQRIKEPATRIPPMGMVGAANDADLCAKVGEVIGDELEAMGFNVDFAPIADVFTNPENTVIGDRAFGTDPEHCGRMAGALMLGLNQAGITACAKHFPGHGDTLLDSHFDLPQIDHGIERLRKVELRPFQRLIAARVPMIMTAHIMVPSIDTTHPITFSQNAISELLRQRLHFQGVVVSDDLEMKAVADRYSIEEMMALGVRAGVDLYLVCHTHEKWVEAFESLVHMGEKSSADRERIAMSAGRLRKLEVDYFRPWTRPNDLTTRLGTAEHHAIIDQVRRKAEQA